MTEVTLFLREYAKSRRDVGAIAPSSSRLCRALTRYMIPNPGRSRAVLEVGPGTGAVTRYITGSLGGQDTLDLIEANPRFATLLRHTYADDPRLRIRTGLLQEHDLGSYDTIVCGLPFANFDARTTEDIFARLLGSLRPGGTLSFFGYVGGETLRRTLADGDDRERTLAGLGALRRILRRHTFRTETVLGNLPPARVHHLAPISPPAQPERVSACACGKSAS
ncbi:class I SAM-dependent methyltransferase [Streptomyces sp. NPDC056149]|uniref:class I SAM-dependent methyltransferase n=1 Tax=unclassified Streptomyces TaxID=2593676 RepID=UPI002380D691|nr:methyltransferase [Streptomyces sp. WZ-12]